MENTQTLSLERTCFPLQSFEQTIPQPLHRVTFGFGLQLILFATQALLLALVTGTF